MDKKRYRLRQAVRRLRCRLRRRALARTTVLAVTGSCGKTTTVRFLGKILSDDAPGFVGIHDNDENSVMRSVSRVRKNYCFLLQEVSGHEPGHLGRVLPLLRPDIGVVTSVGLDHYRSFRGLEATAREKGVMAELLPADGTAVLNADDEHVAAMASRTAARVMTFGVSDDADVRATDVQAAWPQRLSMTVSFEGESVCIETNLFGDLLVSSVLAAVAGGLAAGISLRQCAESLQGMETFSRRMSIHRSEAGAWFVCDSCKASFWSVSKVVAQFEQAAAPRKTLVFGSFSDTSGSDSPKYRSVAGTALEFADRVLFVGKKAGYVRKMLSPELAGRLFVMESAEEAMRLLAAETVPDELILVKSINREHLERVLFGQSAGFRCWKPVCARLTSCEACDESGLM